MGRKKERKPSKSSIKRAKDAEDAAAINAKLNNNNSESAVDVITNGIDSSDEHITVDVCAVTNGDQVDTVKIVRSSSIELKDVKKSGSKSKPIIGSSTTKNAGVPVKGLTNLGNTCFFNSVMQCLAQTHHLRVYMDRLRANTIMQLVPSTSFVTIGDDRHDVEPIEIELNAASSSTRSTPLVEAVADFLHKVDNERSVTPSNLFNQLARRCPRFRSFAQQDSHELLRILMDGLRCDELDRIKEQIASKLGASVHGNRSPPDPIIVAKAKAYLDSASPLHLDRVFGGTLLQSVECTECGHISQRIEPFLDISLPICNTKNNSATRIEKTASSYGKVATNSVSKHQKKKDRHAARKGSARKSISEGSNTPPSTGGADSVQNGIIDRNEADEATTMICPEQSVSDCAVMNGDVTKADDDDEKQLETPTDVDVDTICNSIDTMRIIDGDDDETNNLVIDDDDYRRRIDDAEQSVSKRDRMQTLSSADNISWKKECNLGVCLTEFTAEERLEGKNAYECEHCCSPRNKKIREATKKDPKKSIASAIKLVTGIKRYLFYSPPAVLTIHLKRFEQNEGRNGRITTRKLSGHVEFPLVLDLAPFCSKKGRRLHPNQSRILYALYGVVSHSGDLGGGHYVAYINARTMQSRAVEHFIDNSCQRTVTTINNIDVDDQQWHADESIPESFITTNNGDWYYASDSSVSRVNESRVLGVEAYLLFYERIQ